MADTAPVEPALIACPACDGLGFRIAPCACRHNGTEFLVSGRLLLSDSDPYPDCEICQGSGETTVMCFPCRQGGSLLAQGVVTVVNAVTGQTGSVQVVPGAFEPVPWEARPGRWMIDLSAIVGDLAARVGVDTLYDMLDRPLSTLDLATPIYLPDTWTPSASEAEKAAAEQAAIAEWAGRRRWHLYVGYPAGVRAAADPELRLAELRRAADAGRLDLVVRYLDGFWSVAYEVPGAQPRQGQAWYPGTPTLAESLLAHTPSDLVEQAKSTTTASGHWVVTPPPPAGDGTSAWTVEDLVTAVTITAGGAAGGSATWRDGRWQLSALAVVEERELLAAQQTGQVRSTVERVVGRVDELKTPPWLGPPISTQRCARCVSGVAWRECSCTYLDDVATPDCPRCAGVGRAPDPYCSGCDDTRLVHLGAVVTLIGSEGRGQTTNLRIGKAPDVEFFVNDQGVRCARVPRELTAVAWAEAFGTDVDWLCSHGIRSIGALARDGVLATDLTDPREVVAEYLARLTAGRPGGRLVYFVRPPGDVPVESLLRPVLGVDARAEISIAADSRGRLRWGLAVTHRGAQSRYAPPEIDLTLGDAVGRVLSALPQRLGGIEHDVARTEPLSPAQHGRAVEIEAGISTLLREVAQRYGRVLAAVTREGWTLHAWTQRRWQRIGAGSSLRELVTHTRMDQ
ncbi:hypothetical protein [Cryptosporangium phraense]|uniref:Uncharacterized protein n=1 Tax=Cryptosporangium phraense TaxID=2593070 RepID=A0A545AF77_9ACTN|nr:hypothetical protein [Cryptosporangium phraense]TQS39996.1 hypothetical protein FL583_37245 [Cryptosporangium phraense]